jgi:hypothetical protein
MPLVRGKYSETSWIAKVTGNKANANQANLPVRTNAEYLGLGGIADIAIGATGVSLSVPVPVEVGDVITNISVLAGGTAEATGTHAFMALYAGTGASPALLAQTADDTGAASIAASTLYTKALATPVLITPSNAPNGFVYATINVTAGTVPTLMGCAPAAAAYPLGAFFPGAPRFLSATHDSAAGATAPATMGVQTAAAKAFLAWLS